MRFSEHYGFKPIRSIIQAESVDAPLRNALWSVLYQFALGPLRGQRRGIHPDFQNFLARLWLRYYKLPIDIQPISGSDFYDRMREHVFKGPWYEVYDLIAFTLDSFELWSESDKDDFKRACNNCLEREMSAWRIVGDQITRLTSNEEIQAVEESLVSPGPVATHLATALGHMSNRTAPDYRNSVKESISAVEAMCRIVTGERKATLGAALRQLEKNGINLHAALKTAFERLYGYSSDSEGIRHSLLEESTLDLEDAKFMLVSCAAFTNLLRARSGMTD